jgi:HAD superfamily hydrolase (TIGR01450 family)
MTDITSKIKIIAFDLDGTIYNGNQIIAGANETIDFLRYSGKEICFFTNNSSQSRTQIFNKLRNFSINLLETDVYCCTYATKIYLKTENFKNVFIVGSEVLKEEVSLLGINVVSEKTESKIDAMLIAFDVDFNYSKLATVYEVLQLNNHCKIIVSNIDSSFPVENGLRKPGCGAIASSIFAASGRNYDFMVGKPNSYILDLIAKEKQTLLEEILVIGDSYESDIKMAKSTNAHSILIDTLGINDTGDTITVNCINDIQKIFCKYYF